MRRVEQVRLHDQGRSGLAGIGAAGGCNNDVTAFHSQPSEDIVASMNAIASCSDSRRLTSKDCRRDSSTISIDSARFDSSTLRTNSLRLMPRARAAASNRSMAVFDMRTTITSLDAAAICALGMYSDNTCLLYTSDA